MRLSFSFLSSMPKSTILIGSVSSPTLEFSKNVGEPVGNHRWAVSSRITDASDMVSLLCTGVHLSLTHVKDGEGLTVDDFRFDDLDFHFLFPFLSFLTSYIDILQTRLEFVKRFL